MTFVLPQPATSTSLSVITTLPQVSLPVATPLPALDSSAVHSIVTSAGTSSVGAVVSTTVMTWSPLVVLPQSSVTVHVRVIVSVFPQPASLESLEVTVTLPQLSVPVADPVPAGLVSPVHSTVTSAGTTMLGAIVSTTLTVWAALAVLPQSSAAVNVRVIVSELPQPATLASLHVTSTSASQLSVAVAAALAGACVISKSIMKPRSRPSPPVPRPMTKSIVSPGCTTMLAENDSAGFEPLTSVLNSASSRHCR